MIRTKKEKWCTDSLCLFFCLINITICDTRCQVLVWGSWTDKTGDKTGERGETGKCHSAIRCKGHSLLAVARETCFLREGNASLWLEEQEPLSSVVGRSHHDGTTMVSIEVFRFTIAGIFKQLEEPEQISRAIYHMMWHLSSIKQERLKLNTYFTNTLPWTDGTCWCRRTRDKNTDQSLQIF